MFLFNQSFMLPYGTLKRSFI